MKLLLLEDNPNDEELIRRELIKAMNLIAREIAEFEIVCVRSSNEFKQIVKENKFDVVVADLNVVDSEGLDTVKEVLQATKVPVLVFTGVNDKDVIEQATALGVADFIPKHNGIGLRLLTSALTSMYRNKTPTPAEKILLDSAKNLMGG